MNSNRIKVTLYNRTFKEIDQSDFTRITEGLFSNRDDIVEAKRLLIVQVLKKQIMVVM